MLTAIRATYKQGQLIWHETPPADDNTEVVVTFLEKKTDQEQQQGIHFGSLKGKVELPDDFNEPLEKTVRQGGSMAGEVWMADDFNAPLDDLSDYM